MAKFDNVQLDDTVYHLLCGKGKVISFVRIGDKVSNFKVKFKTCVACFDNQGYLLDDKLEREEKIVTLFWNEVKLPTVEEDKKPFDLVEFLRENLESAEFVAGAENVTFVYNYANNTWEIGIYNFGYIETTYVSKISEEGYLFNDILDVLIEKQITPQQLKQAYKELGWL